MTQFPQARHISRRWVLGAASAGAAIAAGGGYYAWTLRRPFEGRELTPDEALAALRADDIFLVDIRRPEEWDATGIAEGAIAIDMRRDDFSARLAEATRGDPGRPIALICARGVRSSQLTARLEAAGLSNLIDVPEGMLGSRAGPGWLARGLPVSEPRG